MKINWKSGKLWAYLILGGFFVIQAIIVAAVFFGWFSKHSLR
jgi:hypothetical protein